eukprot:GFUD01006619.1.p1 GENE.GFUD01006619.1~~GFUD01006619.1.p1  ORF type:complete len:317 (-),score=84.44 GFUD01006619.1:349-1299(-)
MVGRNYLHVFILLLPVLLQSSRAQSDLLEPPPGQRCSGRNYQGRRCCTPESPCGEGEGDCDGPDDGGQHDGHEGCRGSLVCGSNNCKKFGLYFHEKDDCCERPPQPTKKPVTYLIPIANRCAGRIIDTGKCCTDVAPCDEGEGDCENDDECGDDLVCGNNNCKQFAAFFHPKDDCCVKPSVEQSAPLTTVYEWGEWGPWMVSKSGKKTRTQQQITVKKNQDPSKSPSVDPNTPLEPPAGQRCSGRNYQGRRCCTPENPCDEGEGDCDGPADGGQHDGHEGCKGALVCGSNNCKQFGQYYHEKDDCCEKPRSPRFRQ